MVNKPNSNPHLLPGGYTPTKRKPRIRLNALPSNLKVTTPNAQLWREYLRTLQEELDFQGAGYLDSNFALQYAIQCAMRHLLENR